MERKSPTEMLEAEHHIIQKIVGAMAVMAEALESGHEVNAETLAGVVEFMRIFADKCHHGKEEIHLFPLLEQRGVPARGCPLAVLTHEHDRGRTLVGQMSEAIDAYRRDGAAGRAPLTKSLRALVDLYPGHIWKEEYLLFPMTNKILNVEEQAALRQQFEAVEEGIGRDMHARLERLAQQIEAQASTASG